MSEKPTSSLTYDDYIEADKLLSLQGTLTEYHDELTFKVYHQITELYFRLVIHELESAIVTLQPAALDLAVVKESLSRIIRFFDHLIASFDILVDGLSTEEFLKFREAFGTASGFQSAQFRVIEILSGLTREGSKLGPHTAKETFYWERAARDVATGEPTGTLLAFKERHLEKLNALYDARHPYSLEAAFKELVQNAVKGNAPLKEKISSLRRVNQDFADVADLLRTYDLKVIEWKKSHLKAAAKHLVHSPRGTGETNWAEYLTKSIESQKFFPELHS